MTSEPLRRIKETDFGWELTLNDYQQILLVRETGDRNRLRLELWEGGKKLCFVNLDREEAAELGAMMFFEARRRDDPGESDGRKKA